MFIDPPGQFQFYILQAIDYNLPLLFRQVESLIYFIGEEIIILYIASECRPPNQIRMKQQRPPFRLYHLSVIRHTNHLARPRENHRTFLVIIIITPVLQVAAFYLFQEDCIKAVTHPGTFYARYFREVDHANQRVQRFLPYPVIILADMIHFFYFSHSLSF